MRLNRWQKNRKVLILVYNENSNGNIGDLFMKKEEMLLEIMYYQKNKQSVCFCKLNIDICDCLLYNVFV